MMYAGVYKSSAQIADEIKAYVDSTEIMFNNGRKMLLQSLVQRDILKSTKIFLYLNEKSESKSCHVFNYTEELYIRMLINDISGLLTHMQQINSKLNISLCYQFNEKLNERLFKLTQERLDEIDRELDLNELNEESREILNLINYLYREGKVDDVYSVRLRSFRKKYPGSVYNDFIIMYLPNPILKTGYGMSFGAGLYFPQKSLADYFKSNGSFMFSYDFYFGKIYSSLTLSGGHMELQKKLPDYMMSAHPEITFSSGDNFAVFDGGFALGYMLLNNKRILLAPFMMIGGLSIESTLYPEDSGKKEVSPVNSFYFGPGIHCWFKLAEFKTNNALWYGPYYQTASHNSKSTIALQINLGYNFLTNMYPEMKGNITYVNAGLILGMGNY